MKKITFMLRKIPKSQDGAAATETAITIMSFLIILLGIIQITLMIHAKFLVNYAAYCAARAGIVHNGDPGEMKRAAAVALAPLFSNSDDLISLGIGYAVASYWPGLKVEIISPDPERFDEDYARRFFPTVRSYKSAAGDETHLNENLLKVKVTYRFKLRIPLINQILRPGLKYVDIRSTYQMRMQSDRYTP